MDAGIYELVEKILWAVSFVAIGGALAVMFFLVFAQSILGLRTIHSQLEKLLHQAERMAEQLRQIAEHLGKDKEKPPKKP
jgi:predicted ATP-grasp superfamily ATP-dependent carboligase